MAARNTAASTDETKSDDTKGIDFSKLGKKIEEEREITGVGTFYEDFDNEEYPDAVMPSPGQILVFEVLSSNIVPIKNKRTNTMEDTEVVQIQLIEGTTCTVKLKTEDEDEYEDTGDLEPFNEPRSLWINSFMLRKLWEEWDPQPGDIGALKFKGKVEGQSNTYQKWFCKFKKDKPRRVGTR